MKMLIIRCLVFALLALAAACKVSRDVKLPDINLSGNYRTADRPDTLGIARIPYNSFFTDTMLRDLIDSAVSKNNDLQIAIKNIEKSRLIFYQSKLGNIPAVNASLQASGSRPSDNSLNGLSLSQFLGSKHIEDYTAAVDLSWEADIWGKIKNRKAEALASFLQTGEARKAIQTVLVSDISKGYYNLLMLDTQLAIAKRNLTLNDSTLNMIKLRFQAGEVTSLATQQASAQRLFAARLIPQFEQEIVMQENALSILTGRLPGGIKRSGRLADIQLASELSAGMPSALLGQRPDIRSIALDLEKANAEVGYSKAGMYPSLTITAQGGVNAFKASNWFSLPESLFGGVAAGLMAPVFQRKQLKTNYEIARVEREKVVIQFRQQVLVAVAEVSDALVQLDKLNEQSTLAQQRTETLLSATGNASLLFKNGMANYLEVITAQSTVLESELELASIKKDQLFATVDLYRSVGGGWK